MRPYNANSLKRILSLRRDNLDTPGYWIICDEVTVSMAEQRMGHKATGKVSIPRKDFNKFVRWYMRDQKPRPEKLRSERK